MRYHVILINGDRVATDFEYGDPVRTPHAVAIAETFICRDIINVARPGYRAQWSEHGPTYQRAIPAHAIVGIIDMDCG